MTTSICAILYIHIISVVARSVHRIVESRPRTLGRLLKPECLSSPARLLWRWHMIHLTFLAHLGSSWLYSSWLVHSHFQLSIIFCWLITSIPIHHSLNQQLSHFKCSWHCSRAKRRREAGQLETQEIHEADILLPLVLVYMWICTRFCIFNFLWVVSACTNTYI